MKLFANKDNLHSQLVGLGLEYFGFPCEVQFLSLKEIRNDDYEIGNYRKKVPCLHVSKKNADKEVVYESIAIILYLVRMVEQGGEKDYFQSGKFMSRMQEIVYLERILEELYFETIGNPVEEFDSAMLKKLMRELVSELNLINEYVGNGYFLNELSIVDVCYFGLIHYMVYTFGFPLIKRNVPKLFQWYQKVESYVQKLENLVKLWPRFAKDSKTNENIPYLLQMYHTMNTTKQKKFGRHYHQINL